MPEEGRRRTGAHFLRRLPQVEFRNDGLELVRHVSELARRRGDFLDGRRLLLARRRHILRLACQLVRDALDLVDRLDDLAAAVARLADGEDRRIDVR